MKRTLEEAIKYYLEFAEENEKDAEQFKRIKATQDMILHCYECAKEHRQLAEWLKELKAYREKENCNKPYWAEMEILTNAYDIMGDKTWASKMRCSNCNFITYAIEGKFSQYNYCPQCGKRIGAKYEEVNADAKTEDT